MNLRRWLLLPLINIALALTICIGQAGATLLKDVRIGEYDKFTRIVFEFDNPINTRKIDALEAGRLKIAFPDTSPDLIRKIPVERSDRLRQVHIWVGKTELSAVLTFTFDHFRFESFQLSNPPRIALDVYRMGKSEAMTAESAPMRGNANSEKEPQQHALGKTAGSESAAMSNHHGPKLTSALQPQLPSEDVSGSGKTPIAATTSNSPVSDFSPPQPPASPNHQQARSGLPDQTETASQTAPEPSSLPYYLVVALVVITIIILILLLLMLFSRHRWLDDNKPISVDEFLQRQDERIASLDARIQEQLKRYDDA